MVTNTAPLPRLTPMQWAICATAAIGFAFDSYVLLMLPLIARPALMDLLGAAATPPEVNRWVGLLFYVPAVAGGIFGLLGGYLTDLFGRRRVLVWSIWLCVFGVDVRLRDIGAGAPRLALRHLHWRLREFVAAVAAGRALSRPQPARGGHRPHTQAFGSRRHHGDRRHYLVVTYGADLPLIRAVRRGATRCDEGVCHHSAQSRVLPRS
jgi:hypothetical protein